MYILVTANFSNFSGRQTMDQLQIVSLIASVASLVLALLAIGLSITFFWMTHRISERTRADSNRITEGVNKLEVLVGRFYSDTWSEMRDTYSDMRKHIWSTDVKQTTGIDQEIKAKADERIAQLKDSFGNKVNHIFERQDITDVKIASLKKELIKLMTKLLSESRRVEEQAFDEALRKHIFDYLGTKKGCKGTADDIVESLKGKFGALTILGEIRRMKKDDVVFWNTQHLGPDTTITLKLPI